MNRNLRVGSLFGIPFYLSPSWFLVLALVTWDYGRALAAAFPALGGALPWLLGLGTALLLFASVLAHELGHSLVALRQGINVQSITLFLFGGLAALEKESETPAGAFAVAIAGPAVSLGLFALLAVLPMATPLAGPTAAIVGVLTYINLVLATFNLIPGLPLDGGNVLKALVWKVTGNPYKGTVFASRVGQLVGWAGIITGSLAILGISSVGSIWTLLIGWFLLQNANRSAQSATLQSQLDGLRAADAVEPDSPIVTAHTTLREFADTAILASQGNWRRFLVVDDLGQLVGTVTVEALQSLPREAWTTMTVGDIMQSAAAVQTIESTESLLDVVKLLETQSIPALAVLRDNGTLLGLLERSAIARLLQQPEPAR
jgi:Zn-dependent protease/predicted transcriptional regulator